MDPSISQKIEAILFASGRYIDAKRIAELANIETRTAKRALKALQESYGESGSALQLIEEENAWKLHVRDQYLELASKVVSDTEVSGPVIETLAVIAWRTPALQSKVVDVRGSNTYEHIKELVERGFVTKEPEGRSYRLKITEKFFDYFDVEGRSDIRRVFKEVEERHREKQLEQDLHQKKLAIALQKSQEEQKEDAPKATGARDIEDLDMVLEKSQKARQQLSGDLSSLKKKQEPAPESEEEKQPEIEEPEESQTETQVVQPQPSQEIQEEPKKPVQVQQQQAKKETPKADEAGPEDEDFDMDKAKAAREKAEAAIDELTSGNK